MDKKSRDVTNPPRFIQELSCDEFAMLFIDLAFTVDGIKIDPRYTEYPFHYLILDVDATARKITKRVREQLKQGGSHV